MENWVDIEEFKGLYQVSDLGRVRSIERKIYTRTYPSQIMKKYPHKVGNAIRGERVKLRSPNKPRQIQRSVGNLVLLSFKGKPPLHAKQVKHIDGNPLNNCLNNLKWDINDACLDNEIAKDVLELFNNNVYKFCKQILYKHHKNFLNFRQSIEDDIQEIVYKIYIALPCFSTKDDKTYNKERHFYCFCRQKVKYFIARTWEKELNRENILKRTYFYGKNNEYLDFEELVGVEDKYNIYDNLDKKEFMNKYNVKEKIFDKFYKKEFGYNYGN